MVLLQNKVEWVSVTGLESGEERIPKLKMKQKELNEGQSLQDLVNPVTRLF